MNPSVLLTSLGVLGLGMWALGSSSASPSDEPTSTTGSGVHEVAPVRALAAEAGLPAAWGDFFAWVAWRESKGNPAALNDSAHEADAAARAYSRNRERYEGCGHAPQSYEFGSGGWFGMLPANALAQLGAAHRCRPPSSVFEPRVAMSMAVGFARGLMRWDRFGRVPTWLNLRAMWGWPAMGGDLAYLAQRRPTLRQDAVAVGLPPSWLDQRPPPLPMTAAQVLARLSVKDEQGHDT